MKPREAFATAAKRMKKMPDGQLALSEADAERIVDAMQRRVPQLFRPEPSPTISEVSPRHVDLDDLIGAKEGAHLVGKHERTIHRWQNEFDICEIVAGAKVISRKKLLAHAARHQDGNNDP
jgi:hypothetical protein